MSGRIEAPWQRGPQRQCPHFDTFQLCAGGLEDHNRVRALVGGPIWRHHAYVQEQGRLGLIGAPGLRVQRAIVPVAAGHQQRHAGDEGQSDHNGAGRQQERAPGFRRAGRFRRWRQLGAHA